MAPEKRVERLEALATRTGARLVLVGDGPSRPALERRLGQHGAHFLGRLDGEQLATAYAALDVFMHTGTEETFGQTLQEAMASGVPVVAPAAGGPLDTVGHDVTGLLYAPDDDRDLRRCVDGLLDDRRRRLAMARPDGAQRSPARGTPSATSCSGTTTPSPPPRRSPPSLPESRSAGVLWSFNGPSGRGMGPMDDQR